MDPLFKALSYFRVKKYQESIDICTECLQKNAYDQAFWTLKMRCLTEQLYVDDLEADEDGIAGKKTRESNFRRPEIEKKAKATLLPKTLSSRLESIMDENSISQVARPGTSLRTGLSSSHQLSTPSSSQSIRPVTQSGRPITGILRPGNCLKFGIQTLDFQV